MGVLRSGQAVELTIRMSCQPSLSKSRKAQPAPSVSGKYFFPNAPLLCLKCIPDCADTSANSIGPDGRGIVLVTDGEGVASSVGAVVGVVAAGCLHPETSRIETSIEQQSFSRILKNLVNPVQQIRRVAARQAEFRGLESPLSVIVPNCGVITKRFEFLSKSTKDLASRKKKSFVTFYTLDENICPAQRCKRTWFERSLR